MPDDDLSVFYIVDGRPLPQTHRQTDDRAVQDNVKYLRKTADEIFNAAKRLAEVEQQIVKGVKEGAEDSVLTSLEADRTKAAALLDRPLLQLEAMLAMRRTPQVCCTPAKLLRFADRCRDQDVEAPIEDERSEGADLKFEAGGAISTGPASGNGFEILLQGFNWDSCKTGVMPILCVTCLTKPWCVELVQGDRFSGARFCQSRLHIHLVGTSQRCRLRSGAPHHSE